MFHLLTQREQRLAKHYQDRGVTLNAIPGLYIETPTVVVAFHEVRVLQGEQWVSYPGPGPSNDNPWVVRALLRAEAEGQLDKVILTHFGVRTLDDFIWAE